LMKDNSIRILDHGSTTTIEKDGLYRFTADNPPTAAVLDGKAIVTSGDRKLDLKKDKQTVLSEDLKAEKFDPNKSDDLYAWSNVRSEYEAAASYRVSQTAYTSSGLGGWRGFGYNGFFGPGWYWDNGFSSWAWLPGMGAFYSPFGYGFYSPGLVAYAPVVLVPVRPTAPVKGGPGQPVQPVMTAAIKGIMTNVPINPKSPPAAGMMTSSPAANQAARMQAARSIAASGGFRTASGTPAPAMVGHGVSAAPASAGGGSHGGSGNAGGFHGASTSASMGGGGSHGGGGGGGHK
jgi:hypothetical protein